MSKKLFTLLSAITVSMLATAITAQADDNKDDDYDVKVKVFRPLNGDVAGYDARGFVTSASIQFPGDIDTTGLGVGINPVTGLRQSYAELTGPGAAQQLPPYHGTFSVNVNEHFLGLVVLQDTGRFNARPIPFAVNPFQYTTHDLIDIKNIADLFEITAVQNQTTKGTAVWTDWVQGGSANFGPRDQVIASKISVTIVEGRAPAAVVDANGDGVINAADLPAMGYKVLSNTVTRDFYVNGCQPGKLILQKPGEVVTGPAACLPRTEPHRF
jgi:hypothetical protein